MGFPKTSIYTCFNLKAEYEAARIAVTHTLLEGRYLQKIDQKNIRYMRPYTACSVHPNLRRVKELDDGREPNQVSNLHGSENRLQLTM